MARCFAVCRVSASVHKNLLLFSHLKLFATFCTCLIFFLQVIKRLTLVVCGPGSVVGIATAYWLDGPGIESRWGEIFQTGPEAHPASCTMATRSFPGVRCGRGVTMTPHPLLVPRSKIW